MGAYDEVGPKLRALGYFTLPIGPGTKKPQRFMGSGYCDLVGWSDPNAIPETSPQPGAGLAVRLGKQLDGTWLNAFDWDIEEAYTNSIGSPLSSPIQKRGRKGGTGFHRTLHEIPSRDFKINGKMALQILSTGKQTLVPPTIYPGSSDSYFYLDDRATLEMCKPSEVPLLPEEYEALVNEILVPLGYVPEPEKPTFNGNGHDYDADGEFQILNNAALANLPAWVPQLGLYGCKRQRGSYASYRAVASFRESLTPGKKLQDRETHLLITGKCIKDFAENKGYSPIQLAMVALRLDFGAAVDWLKDKLTPGREKIEIKYETLKSSPRPEPEPEAPPDAQEGPEGDERLQKALGILKRHGGWAAGDDLPPAPKCCFEGILPAVGLGTLDGQWGVHKTHLLADAAVACSCPGELAFAGRSRLLRRGVIIFESEESQIPIRLACAAKHRGTDVRELPLYAFREVRKVLLNRKVDPQAVKWYRETLAAADYVFKQKFGVPLGLVGIDPLIDAYGAEKENSSEEANEAKGVFRKLSTEFGILFWINDHMGKDVERGSRGTSAKPDSADFIFTLPERVVNLSEPRAMWVKKLRNLPGSGAFGVNFSLKPIDVEVEGEPVGNLAVVWGEEVRRGEGGATFSPKRGRPPRKSKLAVDVLLEMMAERMPKGGSHTATWVSLQDWYEELVSRTVIEAGHNQARDFQRLKDRLMAEKEIKVRDGKACVPF